MTTPLEQTEARINNAAKQNYAPYALAKRKPRSFRYSDRRLYKSMKYHTVSAVAGKPLYCAFLGPGGVTLAAPEKDTVPVLTYIRYPVAYRRRMRFIKDFAIAQGVLDEYTDDKGVVHSVGEGMTVFFGDLDQAKKYVGLVSDKDACVTAAGNGDELAMLCCAANKWDYKDESDSESESESESESGN